MFDGSNIAAWTPLQGAEEKDLWRRLCTLYPAGRNLSLNGSTGLRQMKYEPALDGLRGLAVTIVAVYHANTATLPGGWLGVDIFFVLSGYLITRILLDEISLTHCVNLRQFYIRRFLRLMPAFACLLIAMIPKVIFDDHKNSVDTLQSMIMSATYLMNWNRAFNWVSQGPLGHTWSLAMEEQFYLLWPMILIYISRRKALTWIICALCVEIIWRTYLVYSGASIDRTYNGFDTHSDGLLIGCALAFAVNKFQNIQWSIIARKFVLIPIALIAAAIYAMHIDWAFTQSIGLTLSAISSAWLIVAASQDGFFKRCLSLRPLTYTGKISYGWYLWHYPMLLLLPSKIPHGGTIIIFAASYLVAMASHRFVEMPFLRLKARFEFDGRRRNKATDSVDSMQVARPLAASEDAPLNMSMKGRH
jgi:peptidoglycan/LPS O-acetylase OafA/YrhL